MQCQQQLIGCAKTVVDYSVSRCKVELPTRLVAQDFLQHVQNTGCLEVS